MKQRTQLEIQLKLPQLIFRICGQEFFQVTGLKNQFHLGTTRRFPTLGYSLYFALLIILIVLQNVIAILKYYSCGSDSNSVKSFVNHIVENATSVTILLASLMNLIRSFKTTHLQKQIYVNLEFIRDQFNFNLDHQICYKKVSRGCLYRCLIGIFFDFGGLWIMYVVKEYVDIGYYEYLTYSTISLFIIIFGAIHMTCRIKMINLNLEVLKEVLNELTTEEFIPLRSVDRQVLTFINVKSESKQEEIFYRKLSTLKTIYGMIWKTSGLINKVYGPCLVTSVFLIVVSVTVMGYKSIIVAISGRPFINSLGKCLYTCDFVFLNESFFKFPI